MLNNIQMQLNGKKSLFRSQVVSSRYSLLTGEREERQPGQCIS